MLTTLRISNIIKMREAVVHNIPRVYTGTTYNLGSTVNDIYYLKFVAPFDGFFRFDLNSSLNRYYREELTIKKETINGLETIEKVDNIGVSAYNREGSNNLVAYLEDGDIYYILVRDDADLNYCTLKIWYSFEELEQSHLNVNRYGIWDEVMKKDDYMYSYEIPQDGNYEISFVCFDTGNYNMPYIIYQETGGIFTEIRSILINGNTYYYDSYTVYLESGDVLYIGYFDFRVPSSETCDGVVEKIS